MVTIFKNRASRLLLAALKPDQPYRHRLLKHQPAKFFNTIIPGRKLTQEEADLYFGVHTTESFERATVYANNFASVDDPPVIITIDTDYYEEHSDIDAVVGGIRDILSIQLNDRDDILEAARNVLNGEDDGDELNDLLAEADNYDDTYSDPITTISEAIDQESTQLSIFNEVYLDDVEKARAVLESAEGNTPERVLAQATNQFRFKHEIPLVSILQAVQFSPWRNDPIKDEEYEAIENSDEEVIEKLDMHYDGSNVIDDEGRVVFSESNMFDFNYGYGSPITNKKIIWTNPQLSLWKPKRIQYHGTTLDNAMKILELVEE